LRNVVEAAVKKFGRLISWWYVRAEQGIEDCRPEAGRLLDAMDANGPNPG
jgi:hypothetical protein